jgi:hypothetical protein
VFTVAREVAGVSDWPTDYDGYTREIEALRAEPRLAAIHAYFADHPELGRRQEARYRADRAIERDLAWRSESVRWVSDHRSKDRLELAFAPSAAFLSSDGAFLAGGTASAAYVYLAPASDADDDDGDDAFFNVLIGDQLGGELRVHFLHRTDGAQSGEWMTLVGIGPALANRLERSVVRMPTVVGTLVPELGLALRDDHEATWYAAWSLPVSLLLAHDVAFDAALRLFLIEDWLPERMAEDGTISDPTEVIISVSAGVRLP